MNLSYKIPSLQIWQMGRARLHWKEKETR